MQSCLPLPRRPSRPKPKSFPSRAGRLSFRAWELSSKHGHVEAHGPTPKRDRDGPGPTIGGVRQTGALVHIGRMDPPRPARPPLPAIPRSHRSRGSRSPVAAQHGRTTASYSLPAFTPRRRSHPARRVLPSGALRTGHWPAMDTARVLSHRRPLVRCLATIATIPAVTFREPADHPC